MQVKFSIRLCSLCLQDPICRVHILWLASSRDAAASDRYSDRAHFEFQPQQRIFQLMSFIILILYAPCTLQRLVCRTNCTYIKCILHAISYLSHVSAHACKGITGIYSLIIQRTIWKRYENNYEDSLMAARAMCRYISQNLYLVTDIFSECKVGSTN